MIQTCESCKEEFEYQFGADLCGDCAQRRAEKQLSENGHTLPGR